MTDKSSIQQILGILAQRPQLLSEVDKYSLTITDFSSRFEKYLFLAISGLYKQGATSIEPIDVANFLEQDPSGKKIFDGNNGIEYLQDAIDFSKPDNFDYYYNKLKKLNLLRDLKKQGFDITPFYEEDLASPRATEINAKFEELTTKDICDQVKGKLLTLEGAYAKSSEVEVFNMSDGIEDFVEEMAETVNVGLSLQGRYYSHIIGGAQLGTLTIRSASSGCGKTRYAVGDACKLAYPISYNDSTASWEITGHNEKVLFIITEQTYEQIRRMVLAYLTGINESRFNYGDLTKEERERISIAIYIMKTYDNFTVIKMPSPTIELVKTLVRENCLVKNISYVFFDYVFINPSLLATFQGFSLRNDEVLLMFATALKDLAVELNVAMFTSTQVNANADDNKNIRNEASLAGGRSTINKADNGCILARPAKEELETLEPITSKYGIPNLVLDIFKVRSGQWSQVRVWIKADLGTMRFQDLFVTDSRLEFIDSILADEHEVYNWDDEGYQKICKEKEKCNLKKCSLNV